MQDYEMLSHWPVSLTLLGCHEVVFAYHVKAFIETTICHMLSGFAEF